MKNFGKLTDCQTKNNTVNFTFAKGEGRVEILTDKIVNVFSPFASNDHRSKAIEGDKARKTDFFVEHEKNCVKITTRSLKIRVYSGFKVDFYTADGKLLCKDYRGKLNDIQRLSKADIELMKAEGHDVPENQHCNKKINVAKTVADDECLMGLGDKSGFTDKRGYEYVMWNTDNTSYHHEQTASIYKSIPFYISKRPKHKPYGLFFDNTYRSIFNMARDYENVVWYGANDGNLDYYFILGDNIPEVIGGYTYLTGTTPLPQKWTLGYGQSRWGYVDEEDIMEIADKMRANDIPCDSVYFDIDYMQNYKVFTWNKDRYKDPAATLKALNDMGIKAVTIIDPGVKAEEGYHIYEQGKKEGYFATDNDGEIYENRVWPGRSVFPDFGKKEVRDWWADNISFNTGTGVSGIWNDMNEPASFNGEIPPDVVMHDGNRVTTHAEMHNVYGHFMNKATYEGLLRATGKRPFVLTRAAYSGTQKYAAAWTGDNHSLWGHLKLLVPQLCSLGMCGMSMVGTDIGGFLRDTTPELLVRWVEAALFSPVFRNHCDKPSRRQEPWQFDEKTLDIYRKFVKLHYSFIPYIYDLLFEGEKTGLAVMRSLALHYEDDPIALGCDSQYLVGENLLCAPVLEHKETTRQVYLPRGEWYDFFTGKKFKGARHIVAKAPLDFLPLYAKSGAIIPLYPDIQSTDEKVDSLTLKIFPGNGKYIHYEDDGESFDYRDGAYNSYEFTIDEKGCFTFDITHKGYDTKYKNLIVQYLEKEIKLPFKPTKKSLL